MSDKHRGVPGRVLRAGAAATASPGLLEAIRSAENATLMPDPVRGQLWRASWEDVRQLVLVLRVTGTGTAVVAPVTADPPTSDESSLMLDASLTVLGHAATVWGGLAAEIPFLVFDLVIGAVAPAIVTAAEEVAVGEGRENLPEGVRAGTPVESVFDPAEEVRAELSDALEFFRDATWAPHVLSSGKPLRELLMGRSDVRDLMRELAEALSLKLPEVIDLLKGTRPVNPRHVPAIARITGLTEQEVLSAASPIPGDLVRELDRPRWRKALTAQRLQGGSEMSVRLTVAYGTLALAARQTGSAAADPWPQRVRHYLDTHQPDRRDP